MRLRYSGIIEYKTFGHSPPALFLGTSIPLLASIFQHVLKMSATDMRLYYQIGAGQPVSLSGKCSVVSQIRYRMAQGGGGVFWDEVLTVGDTDVAGELKKKVGESCLLRIELISQGR